MSTIRRSSRQRKHPSTIYDEAKAEIRSQSPKRRKIFEDSDSDDDTEVSCVKLEELQSNSNKDMAMDVDEKSTSSSSSEESEAAPKKRRRPIKINVQFNQKKAKIGNAKKFSATKGAAKSRLVALRKKTLDPEETTENSLTAAVLNACTSNKKNNETTTFSASNYPAAFLPTEYTEILEPVAKKMLSIYQEDSNKGHIFFLNFIFRSVGGTYASIMDPSTTVLDDMDDDEWEATVTGVVDAMRHTPHDAILISSCPKGAVHANGPNKHNLAQEEFRRIFEHFWYLLGNLAVDTTSTSSKGSSFDIERLRDLACRIMELVTVGQPDLRSAATQSATMLALAACDGTLAFHTRLTTAQRQFKAARVAKTAKKSKALQQTVNALERSLKDLQQVVTETIVPAVFMRRYRDSDPYIRAFCLESLGQFIRRRADIFLQDIYTKYPSWMMSDKEAVVRVAALRTLNLPFVLATEQKKQNNIHPLQAVHISSMRRVMDKFLPRIVNCVTDVSTDVQHEAMQLILSLMRHGFMDNVEDDRTWNRINIRSLAPDTTPEVRRCALYFILEQLEAFDVANKKNNVAGRQNVLQIDAIAVWAAHALSDGRIPIDCLRVHLVDFLVQSLRDMPEYSHLMTDWSAMLEAIQEEADTDFSQQRVAAAKQRVLLQILASAAAIEIGGSSEANTSEKCLLDEGLIKVLNIIQPPTPHTSSSKKKKRTVDTSQESLTIELLKTLPGLIETFAGNVSILRSLTSLPRFFALSVVTLPQRKPDVQALVKILGDLYLKSTDVTILQNICLSLTVLAKGGHARNQEALLKLKGVAVAIQDRLFGLYHQQEGSSGDSTTQQSRTTLTSRTPDTQATHELEENATVDGDGETTVVASTVADSPVAGMSIGGSTFAASTVGGSTLATSTVGGGSTRGGTSTVGNDSTLDQQHAILCCLRRLRILSKRWYLGVLLSRDLIEAQIGTTDESDPSIHLCSVIAKVMAKDLKIREIVVPEDDDGSLQIPDIWDDLDPQVHKLVAASVGEGLKLILAITAWRLYRALNREKMMEKQKKSIKDSASDEADDQDDTKMDDATVDLDASVRSIARARDGLVKLLTLCFDMYLEKGTSTLNKDQIGFSLHVQSCAGKVGADLRTLFPPEWDDAKSSLLRSCSLSDSQHVVGGFARFFRHQEEALAKRGRKGRAFRDNLLLPLARGLCSSWAEGGNRREAGSGISHVVHPSEEVAKAAASLHRTLKKIEPVRLVEAHMACLIQAFSEWLDSEPEEPESDRPSEQEMLNFAKAEKAHEDAFKLLELKAGKLSASLGVGKLSNEKLYPAMAGFVKEGIRYAFSHGGDDELALGSRLPFLSILLKYLGWMKKKKSMMKQICDIFQEKEAELRSDPDFEDLEEEDMKAVETFSKALGLTKAKASERKWRTPSTPAATQGSDEEDSNSFATPKPPKDSLRMSQASSVRSARSNLSPLPEDEDSDSDDDDVPIKVLQERKLPTPIRDDDMDNSKN